MFWSDKKQGYELPYSERKEFGSNITEYSCPVCGQPLEVYEYSKENQQKQMLRCSDAQARRRDDHKDAVYFASKGVFWSPKYGEVGSASQASLTKISSKSSGSKAETKSNGVSQKTKGRNQRSVN
jgi:hypothetical protein